MRELQWDTDIKLDTDMQQRRKLHQSVSVHITSAKIISMLFQVIFHLYNLAPHLDFIAQHFQPQYLCTVQLKILLQQCH